MNDINNGENVWDSWFSGKEFTTDWSSRAFPTWAEVFSDIRESSLNILEIGAWEGRGSLFLLNFFSKSRITCMDIFTLGNEGLFDRNLAEFAERTTKVVGRSVRELDRMAYPEQASAHSSDNSRFDLIYVDGSHDRDDVMIDSLLAWRLLNVGGILIWDDYEIFTAMPGHFTPQQDPKPSIDTFLGWHNDELEVLHRGYQLIVRKTAPHYASQHG